MKYMNRTIAWLMSIIFYGNMYSHSVLSCGLQK